MNTTPPLGNEEYLEELHGRVGTSKSVHTTIKAIPESVQFLWKQYYMTYPHIKDLNDQHTPERQWDFKCWLDKMQITSDEEAHAYIEAIVATASCKEVSDDHWDVKVTYADGTQVSFDMPALFMLGNYVHLPEYHRPDSGDIIKITLTTHQH